MKKRENTHPGFPESPCHSQAWMKEQGCHFLRCRIAKTGDFSQLKNQQAETGPVTVPGIATT